MLSTPSTVTGSNINSRARTRRSSEVERDPSVVSSGRFVGTLIAEEVVDPGLEIGGVMYAFSGE
jgi:hypothetical protein